MADARDGDIERDDNGITVNPDPLGIRDLLRDGLQWPVPHLPVLGIPHDIDPLSPAAGLQLAGPVSDGLTQGLFQPEGQGASSAITAHLTNADSVASAPVDPEIWFVGSNTGGVANELGRIDDVTGNGTASNFVDIFDPNTRNPSSTPTDPLTNLNSVQFDTAHNEFFLAGSNASGEDNIYRGSISQADGGTATPVLTEIFHDPAHEAITGLTVDPDSQQIFFTDGQSFYKMSENVSGIQSLSDATKLGTITALDSNNSPEFLDSLAVDLPHHVAYFGESTAFFSSSTQGLGPGHTIPIVSIGSNTIYKTSTLNANTSSVTISKLVDVDPHTFGIISGGTNPNNIAVDTTTGNLYFTTVGDGASDAGGIYEIDAGSSTIHIVWQQAHSGTGATGSLSSIVIDDQTGKYYVTEDDFNGASNQNAIYVGNLSDRGVAPTLFEVVPNYAAGSQISPLGMALDNAPLLTVTGAGHTYTETVGFPSADGTPVSIISGTTLTDSDNSELASATVGITGGFDSGVDKLSINGSASGTVAGTSITYSYNAGTGVMTLSGADTLAHYQTALQDVSFVASGDNPDNFGADTQRTLTYSVSDGLLTNTAGGAPAQTATIDVSGINDPPQLGGAGNSTSYTERGAAAAIDGAITVADPDSQTLASASIVITNMQAGDELKINGATSGTIVNGIHAITYSFSGNTLSLTGADTVGDYQSALRLVTFDSTSHDPTLGGADPSRTISFTADDGNAANHLSTAATSTVNIAAVDDAPTATAPAGPYLAGNQTTLDLKNTGLSVGDIDGGSGSETLTVSVGEGTLHGTAGGSGASVSGDGSSTLIVSGTVAEIDAFLNTDSTSTISYIDNNTPAADTTFSLSIDDNNNTGTGGPLSGSASLTIDQAPRVTAFTGSGTSGSDLTASHGVSFTVQTGKAVNVGSMTTLTLSDGTVVHYVSGDGTQSLVFTGTATVAPASGLTVSSVSGGTIMDAVGNPLDLTGASVTTYTDAVIDTGANIGGHIDGLQGAVANISGITDSDSGLVTVTQTQFTADAAALDKIAGAYDVLVTGASGTAPNTGVPGAAPHYTSFENVYDASHALTQTIYFNTDGTQTTVDTSATPVIDDHASTHDDYFNLSGTSAATVTSGTGNDLFYFGAGFNASDTVNAGGGTNNQIGLEGDYSGIHALTLGASTLTGVQAIVCLGSFAYDITTVDANVAAGQRLEVWAASTVTSLTFNGAAETDGRFLVYGSPNADHITGGAGSDSLHGLGGGDTLTGGAGADTFVYAAPSDSTSTGYDTITDFDALSDKFIFPTAVTGIDSAVATGVLDSGASFDSELAAAVGSLAAHHAVLFTPDSGTLANHTFLIVDANGTAGYQTGQDYVIDLTGAHNLASLSTADFERATT